jgi:histidinol-phosphate/aromatic aminotransferase/cobyric acid decarboxylase-like protein
MTDPIPASEIEAIRERADQWSAKGGSVFMREVLNDRATLLRALDAATEENARLREALSGVMYQAMLAPSGAHFCADLARKALNPETSNG